MTKLGIEAKHLGVDSENLDPHADRTSNSKLKTVVRADSKILTSVRDVGIQISPEGVSSIVESDKIVACKTANGRGGIYTRPYQGSQSMFSAESFRPGAPGLAHGRVTKNILCRARA